MELEFYRQFLEKYIKFHENPSSRSRIVPCGQLGSHLADFHEILYLSTFPKPVEKIQVLVKPD
jgi:hypothetical protein